MNKKKVSVIGIVILLLAAAGVGAWYVLCPDESRQSKKAPVETAQKPVKISKKACELFTLDDAKQVLGQGVKQNDETAAPQMSSPTAQQGGSGDSSTACMYHRADQDLPIMIAVLLQSDDRAQATFDSMRTDDATAVEGYGKQAFWRTIAALSGEQTGQLVVLAQGGVVSVAGSAADFDNAKKIMSVVEGRLYE